MSQRSSRFIVRTCPLLSVSVRIRPYYRLAPRSTLHSASLHSASRPPVLSPPFSAISPRSPRISPEKPEKIEKNLKFRLQKRNSMIYYVSVARRKRRCCEADITLKNFADRNFLKNFRFKKIEKISKKRFAKTKNSDILCFCRSSSASELIEN